MGDDVLFPVALLSPEHWGRVRRPGVLRGAVLLSPMVPFEPDRPPDLRSTAVFISAGRTDPIAPAAQAERLAGLPQCAGAEVTLHWTDGGHAISNGAMDAARQWIAHHGSEAPTAPHGPGASAAADAHTTPGRR